MPLSSITAVPKIMRARGWMQGAALLQEWFAGPSIAKPNYTRPDLTTIKMDWILSFPRAKSVYDQMVSGRVWANDAAKPIVARRLREKNLSDVSFDFSNVSQVSFHDIHVNTRSVDGEYGGFDGLTAALGNFSLYVSPISGDVSNADGRLAITIDKVGFQAVDSFDFDGDQYLGNWDENSNRVYNGSTKLGGVPVYNESFRKWRSSNMKGGDFMVFSDIKTLEVSPPVVFVV
jgi:hypothetical protein